MREQAKIRRRRVPEPDHVPEETATSRADETGISDPADHSRFVARLNFLVGRAGSVRAIADLAGVQEGSVRQWLKNSEPSRDNLVRLADAMGVNMRWLARGKGEIWEREVPEGYAFARLPYKEGEPARPFDFLEPKKEWLRSLPGSPTDLYLAIAAGDFMKPTILDGDLVLVNIKDCVPDGGVFAIGITRSIADDGGTEDPGLKGWSGIAIKNTMIAKRPDKSNVTDVSTRVSRGIFVLRRVQPAAPGEKKLVAVPDNPHRQPAGNRALWVKPNPYQPHIAGRVVWFGRTLP